MGIGLVPRGHRDRFAFQEIDLRATFGSHAKLVETIDDAARIPEHVARAFAAARSGRPGPVVLGLPEDMLTDEAAVADADPIPVPEGAVSDAELVRLHDLLTAAERPMVRPWSPIWVVAAMATSSTRSGGSAGLRRMSSRMTRTTRSSARVCA